jgi:uncharacterized protein YndB with AHSA1/START domain
MGHEFEISEEIALEATPEQVWDAIATGPGINSWFMGHNTVEGRVGGRTTMTIAGHPEESTITAYEPGKHLAYQGNPAPDGSFMAFEYLIEGRDGGSTVLRFVHSGILGDDDWSEQYDALRVGDGFYLRKLAAYVKHFPGRTANYSLFLLGPQVAKDRLWSAVHSVLGVTGPLTEGDKVTMTLPGLPSVDGVVAIVRGTSFVAVRTADGLYSFIHGYNDMAVVENQSFADAANEQPTTEAIQSWLANVA